jgi:hypothetical protein
MGLAAADVRSPGGASSRTAEGEGEGRDNSQFTSVFSVYKDKYVVQKKSSLLHASVELQLRD